MRSWFLALLLCVGCETNCQGSSDPPSPLSSIRWVPAEAENMVQTDQLETLIETVEPLFRRLPDASGFRVAATQWQKVLGIHPLKAEDWELLGVDSDQRATVFRAGDSWVLHGQLASTKMLETWLEARREARTFEVDTEGLEGWETTLLSSGGEEVALFAVRNRELLMLPAGRLLPGGATTGRRAALRTLLLTPADQRMEAQGWVKEFTPKFAKSNVAGTARPASWLPESMRVPQADVIYQRMKKQLGPLGFTANYRETSQTLELELMSSGDPREPTFVRDLKGARGTLPVVGGLVDAGVLGVARVSVSPRKFFDFGRSLLPAETRTELDSWIQRLDSVLRIDVVGDVLTNIKGHAVVAIYGFDPELLKLGNSSFAFDLLSLRATREAVLIPIDDQGRMERVLNAWTQASQGRLNRQAAGSTLQYAWLDEGALEWAIILAEDHVVFVDSTAAFDHALVYERAARPVEGALVDRGLPELLTGVDRSGFYVDAASLANLLSEAGNTSLAAWAMPFRSILVTSDVEKGVHQMKVRATLSR